MGKHRYQNGQKKRDIKAGHLICSECGVDKPLHEFSIVSAKRTYIDGTPEYNSRCKACKNIDTKSYKKRMRTGERGVVDTVRDIRTVGADDGGVLSIRHKIESLRAEIETLERAELILLTHYS